MFLNRRKTFLTILIIFAVSLLMIVPSLARSTDDEPSDKGELPSEISIPGQALIYLKMDGSLKGAEIRQAYESIQESLEKDFSLGEVKVEPVYKTAVKRFVKDDISEAQYHEINQQKNKSDKPIDSFMTGALRVSFSENQNVEEFVRNVYDQKCAGYKVERAEEVKPIFLNYTPNDTLFDYQITYPLTPAIESPQWGLVQTEALWAWNLLQGATPYPQGSSASSLSWGGSSSIKIAIIDTGVDVAHPDLAANISYINGDLNGYDTVSINETSYNSSILSYYGYFTAPWIEDYHVPDNDPQDKNGHGTHCAGIAAATTNNTLGVAGVAHSSKIMPVRAGFIMRNANGTDIGLFDPANIADAIIWATDNGADVISMSFGSNSINQGIKDAINYANNNEVILVAAAGNSNSSQKAYPAAYDGVLAVGASDKNDIKAYFSNYGKWVDVAAPGVDIVSTIPELQEVIVNGTAWQFPVSALDPYPNYPGYKLLDGTSMAAPLVAGQAALVKARYPQLSNQEIAGTIVSTTDPLHYLWYGESRKDILNYAQGFGNDVWDLDEYALNFEGLMGSGRVNVKKSLVQGSNVYIGPDIKLTKKHLKDTSNTPISSIPIGQIAHIILNIENKWINASNVSAQIISLDGKAQVLQGSYSFGDAPAMEVIEQSLTAPFVVESIEPSSQNFLHDISFDLQIQATYIHPKTGAQTNYSENIPFIVKVGESVTLIVNDDPAFVPYSSYSFPVFTTIQSAIDFARDGDTVFVMTGNDGVYYERINFNSKKITVLGNPDYPETVTISAKFANGNNVGGVGGPTVKFNNSEGWDSVLKGFTVTGGSKGSSYIIYYGSYYYFGGGITCFKATPSLENLIVENNQGFNGGGIEIYDETDTSNAAPVRMNLRNIRVQDNEGKYFSGGIFIHRGRLHPEQFQVRIENSHILNNHLKAISTSAPNLPADIYGAGIYSYGLGLTLWNTIVSDNILGSLQGEVYSGAAIGSLDTDLHVTHCTIMNNRPYYYPDISDFATLIEYQQNVVGGDDYSEIVVGNSLEITNAYPDYMYPRLEMRNSLIWEYHNNLYPIESVSPSSFGAGMPSESLVNVTIEYSDVKNGNSVSGAVIGAQVSNVDPFILGEQNLDADPNVVDPINLNILERYYKIQSYPCFNGASNSINTGLSTYVGPAYDIENTSRPIFGVPDVGAYEIYGSGGSGIAAKKVTGHVWYDDDYNYTDNSEDPVVFDYVFAYYNGNMVDYDVTDSDGNYTLYIPPFGETVIVHECGMISSTAGYKHTYPMASNGDASAYYVINGGSAVSPIENKDFGIVREEATSFVVITKPRLISGHVWYDQDMAGDMDTSEDRTINEKVRINLIGSFSSGPVLSIPIPATTNANGYYQFFVPEGIYVVSHQTGAPENSQTQGYWHTTPASGVNSDFAQYIVSVSPGQYYGEKDFGIWKEVAGTGTFSKNNIIEGRVWYDDNYDQSDVGESGVTGQQVVATEISGAVGATSQIT